MTCTASFFININYTFTERRTEALFPSGVKISLINLITKWATLNSTINGVEYVLSFLPLPDTYVIKLIQTAIKDNLLSAG